MASSKWFRAEGLGSALSWDLREPVFQEPPSLAKEDSQVQLRSFCRQIDACYYTYGGPPATVLQLMARVILVEFVLPFEAPGEVSEGWLWGFDLRGAVGLRCPCHCDSLARQLSQSSVCR